MRIVIGHQSSQTLVHTISLSQSIRDPDDTIMFRCYVCANQIVQIRGRVTAITAGLISTIRVSVIHRCSKCHTQYVFEEEATQKVFPIVLSLSTPFGRTPVFHCIRCYLPLLRYSAQTPTPQDILCSTPSCHEHYVLQDVGVLS